MAKIVETRNRARIDILNYIINFCTTKYYGDNLFGLNQKDLAFHEGPGPKGSLVKLSCAPNSQFYLSWFHETRQSGLGTEYLLESIEDGKLCWWSNVEVSHLATETTDRFNNWRWTDKQYAFADKFRKVLKKSHRYSIRENKIIFKDNIVTIEIGEKFSFNSDKVFSRDFSNWKRMTQKDIFEFCNEALDHLNGNLK